MPSSAVEVDAVVHDVHDRCRERLGLLARLVADEPEQPASAWARWFGGKSRVRDIEASIEASQRRVSSARMRAERARTELAVLREEAAAVGSWATRLAGGGQVAVIGAGRLRECEAVLAELAALTERLADGLERLAAAGEADLVKLDRALGRVAAEAAHRDLTDRVGPSDSVRRIDLAGRDGRSLVLAEIDHLREEVHVLAAGGGSAWRAAEAEVTLGLGDVVERWRRERDGG